ncbi:MAG: hypothetical protein KDB82_00530 [Planctomycetes bacterium]|nr:hypothetical protein [Planctomycetota bacterium]
MAKWLIILAVLLAAPVYAQQEGGNSGTDPDSNAEPVDPWADFEVSGLADGEYLPLTLGRDRTGIGLRARGSFGWDSNIFREDKDDDTGLFIDGASYAYAGLNLGLFSIGARGQIAGRLYFGDPDADRWDVKLGGFFKMPYNGGFGFGISADVLYQQLTTYEVTGPLIRQDDLRASGAIARAYVGYEVAGFIIFELGFTGQTTDFTEEQQIPSLDSWTIGSDFGIYFDILGFLELHPYVAFDYEWFRDQLDLQDDGTPLSTEDKLQLLKFNYGSDFKLNLPFIEAAGRVYSIRQDDSAAGYERYWQYGLRAAADLNLVGDVRLTVGAHFWTREYDDRVDVDNVGVNGTKTVQERYLNGYVELAWNFWEFFAVGARYAYIRRTSDIDNAGYAQHEITAFLEIGW